MPNTEPTAEGVMALIKQLSDKEFDKLCEMLLAEDEK